jgi:teichuronic acid biosynthesis glycosyltransferase TuaG
MPIVSVIMPCFNSEKFIEASIQSVLNQTFKDFELIVVDGGSSDNTIKIIKKLASSDARLSLLENLEDQGPAHARYKGIIKSKGIYVAFLDADDLWLNNKLYLQINFMNENDLSFSYTRYRTINETGSKTGCLIPMYRSYNFTQALGRRGIGTLTVVLKKSMLTKDIIEHYGKSHGEEYLWWLLILKKGAVAQLLDIDTARYRNVGDSLSTHRFIHQKTLWNTYRNEINLTFFSSVFFYTTYILDASLRKIYVFLCGLTSRITI